MTYAEIVVLNFLRSNKKRAFSLREISEKINLSITAVHAVITSLLSAGLIKNPVRQSTRRVKVGL